MKSFSNPPESWYHVQVPWGQDLDRDDVSGDAEEAQRARQDALDQELNHGVAHDDYLGVKPGNKIKKIDVVMCWWVMIKKYWRVAHDDYLGVKPGSTVKFDVVMCQP